MKYTTTDANFDDNVNISELEGAQLYNGSSSRSARSGRGASAGNGGKSTSKKRAAQRPSAAAGQSRAPVKSNAVKPVGNGAGKPAVREDKNVSLTKSAKLGLLTILSTKNEVSFKTVKSTKKSPLPVSALLMALLCTALLMFMVVSYVQINEYTVEVSRLRSEVDDMVSQDKELTLELEKKNDMLEIEKKASELGMVKVDQLTKKHITLAQEDKIEVVEPEPTQDSTVVTTIMSSLWQNFSGLWEYLG